MFGKAPWDAVKAFFDAMKVPLIILAVILLYRYPQKIREFIDRAGFRVEEISVAGVRLAEKAAADLEGTGQKLDQVTAALAERDLLLREIAAAQVKRRGDHAEKARQGPEPHWPGTPYTSISCQQFSAVRLVPLL